MKKLLLAVAATGMLLTGVGVANATADHKPQDHGLCTAFFNGQKNGWAKNGTPPPFQDLITRADDGNSNTSPEQDVYNYCQAVGISGNPDQNGRYPGCFDTDSNTPC